MDFEKLQEDLLSDIEDPGDNSYKRMGKIIQETSIKTTIKVLKEYHQRLGKDD